MNHVLNCTTKPEIVQGNVPDVRLMNVKQRNDNLFRMMKADPENLSFRSLNGTEIVNHFDMGGCEVCGARYHGEPAPLRYPDCRTCTEKPSCHHGRCCPRQPHGHRQANMFRISPSRYGSSRPSQEMEAVSSETTQHEADEAETQDAPLERPARRKIVIGHQED